MTVPLYPGDSLVWFYSCNWCHLEVVPNYFLDVGGGPHFNSWVAAETILAVPILIISAYVFRRSVLIDIKDVWLIWHGFQLHITIDAQNILYFKNAKVHAGVCTEPIKLHNRRYVV